MTALVWKAIYLFREVNRNLARFNPVKLEFWKRVRFSSDEFVDFAIVKRIPQWTLQSQLIPCGHD